MTEPERIEMTAAEWHAMTESGGPGRHVSFVTALYAEMSGFLDGLRGRPWRKSTSKGKWARTRKRIWWEAGRLARDMTDGRPSKTTGSGEGQ